MNASCAIHDLRPSVLTEDRASVQLEDLLCKIANLESQLRRQEASVPDVDQLNFVAFEGSRDKLLAAFVIASGAAACGMKVRMFFTFWAIAALRKGGLQFGKKTLVERDFGWMLPNSLAHTKLSQLHMAGLGQKLLTNEMKKRTSLIKTNCSKFQPTWELR